MTRLLLDTTFLISAERTSEPVDELIAEDDDAAIAAITLAELRVGVRLADGTHRAGRQAFVDLVVDVLPVVGYDVDVAAAHAELLAHVRRSGTPRGAHDLIIAATGLATGRTIVTADWVAFDSLPGIEVRAHR